MEMTSAILTVIYIVMLNCFLNKKLILNKQLIKYNIKISKIFSIKSRENHEILFGNDGKIMIL